jgi:hypothetical protein
LESRGVTLRREGAAIDNGGQEYDPLDGSCFDDFVAANFAASRLAELLRRGCGAEIGQRFVPSED